MKLLGFRSLWDMVPLEWKMNASMEALLEKIAEAGFAGVEFIAPARREDEGPFLRKLEALKLQFIGQVSTSGSDHAGSFNDKVKRISQLAPRLIVSQSAKDSMPYDAQLEFFECALEIERQAGIPVAHETHRGRAMFTPWTTARLLRELPELKIAADFSHWVVACERLPVDESKDIKLALDRAIHIHGRVGYPEGPQVPDPRDPWASHYVETHLGWWEEIVRNRLFAGSDEVTFTPEFGPPDYLHTHPFTGQPVADTWDINLWMLQRFLAKLKELYPQG